MVDNQYATKSLAEQVRWQLLWLGSGLFLACLLLLFIFAWRATELTTKGLLQLEAQSLLHLAAEQKEFQLPRGDTLSAYRTWNSIPDDQKSHFGQPPHVSGKIVETELINEKGEVEYLYILHHVEKGFGEIFLVARHSVAEIESAYMGLFYNAIQQAFWLTLVIFIALFFLVKWLISKTTKPLIMLSQWASHLSANPDQILDINFPVKELNQLAAQLSEGVNRIQAFNLREQQFLKHASHELRTPLAIIQTSLDTLDLQSNNTNRLIVQRALKASANMRNLTLALLWLARELDSPIKKSKVDVQSLCDQIYKNHRALIIDRDVEVRFIIHIDTIEVEKELFTIVTSNLIKNALQHSANGMIKINITKKDLRVVNPTDDQACLDSEPGFGLGLQLVQRICDKLDWVFDYQANTIQVSVAVTWNHSGS
jgi:two-component sensor histidine kinase